MKTVRLFSKLFLGSSYFTIALREKQQNGIAESRLFKSQRVCYANKNDWMADPMLAEDGGRTWLFYEAVKGNKGRIEVAEVLEGCLLSESSVILEDSCHYSYPFVFKADGVWYMIPESSAAKEVRLYRSVSFPFHWKLQTILLRERAVDTTVFKWQGVYWLLTFLPDLETERVTARAFTVKEWEHPVLHEVPWKRYDSLRVRGAGPVFISENGTLRPAQISQLQRYGDGLVFYHPCFSGEYTEEQVFEISKKNLKIKGILVDGVHTYCSSSRYEAIDIRCRELEPFKIVKRVVQKLDERINEY